MKRLASFTTAAALAGSLAAVSSAAHANSNMWLVPISPLNASYQPGDTVTFAGVISLDRSDCIVYANNFSVGWDPAQFNTSNVTAVTNSAALFPPRPSTLLWNSITFNAISNTTKAGSVSLDTLQLTNGHSKTLNSAGHILTLPAGAYTVGTFSLPILSTYSGASVTAYLPTPFGYDRTADSADGEATSASGNPNPTVYAKISNTVTIHDPLFFPNDGVTQFSSLTFQVTPEPGAVSLLIAGGLSGAGLFLRRRRAAK